MYEASVLNVLTYSYKPVALKLITKNYIYIYIYIYILYKAGESQKIFSLTFDEYLSYKLFQCKFISVDPKISNSARNIYTNVGAKMYWQMDGRDLPYLW
jgi:hypothetical protein